MLDSYILDWIVVGFIINSLLIIPVVFSPRHQNNVFVYVDWTLFIATTLTWPATVYKLLNGLRKPS